MIFFTIDYASIMHSELLLTGNCCNLLYFSFTVSGYLPSVNLFMDSDYCILKFASLLKQRYRYMDFYFWRIKRLSITYKHSEEMGLTFPSFYLCSCSYTGLLLLNLFNLFSSNPSSN